MFLLAPKLYLQSATKPVGIKNLPLFLSQEVGII